MHFFSIEVTKVNDRSLEKKIWVPVIKPRALINIHPILLQCHKNINAQLFIGPFALSYALQQVKVTKPRHSSAQCKEYLLKSQVKTGLKKDSASPWSCWYWPTFPAENNTPASRGSSRSAKTLQRSRVLFLVNNDLVFPEYKQQPHDITKTKGINKSASNINFTNTSSPQTTDNRVG